MALRASNIKPSKAYETILVDALTTKSICQAKATQYAAGASAKDVLDLLRNLRVRRAKLAEMMAVPGLAEYARAQEDDPAYDVVAEGIAYRDAVDAAITQIVSTFPSSTFFSLDASGGEVFQSFTGAQLTALITRLNAVAAAVT